MSNHLHIEIQKTKKRLLKLSAYVEETLRLAIKAYNHSDLELAEKVMKDDDIIDQQELDIEEECLKILALYQPVATDLRFIVAVLKINSDLERIGDHAASMANRTVKIANAPKQNERRISIEEISELTISMLKKSIDALVSHDTELAYTVFEVEKVVNKLNKKVFTYFVENAQNDVASVEATAYEMFVARYLERIADHAVNIAEDVIYMIKGDIVRHQIS
ncbi:phosphate signaling complex protein PhoU [bacterium]|nr:phosphate signaling complex protein PhoU [bacterium]